ncbi:Leucine-rich repeat domain, L domain-like [Phytophthora cactorum]|nr:Leucine-rich repeat domain, L domain-like [Phytophthora cactorum]
MEPDSTLIIYKNRISCRFNGGLRKRGAKKWECIDLVKIDLSHNAIPSISAEIGGLTSVTSIKLTKNALQVLPEDFSSSRHLPRPVRELWCLGWVKRARLIGNKLSRLPNSITLLENLEALHIEENTLTALPEQIGKLQKLHVLNAHSNQLTVLPSSFGALRNMQNLDLKKNRLESTGDALATLSLLKFLDLRQNKLVVFPVLPEGAALDQVYLGYNSLSTVDETSILRVKDSVTVLDMRDNKLAGLPANIACLYRLKTLDVANNDLSDLPPGLGYLKHLNHFIVDGNPLRAIRRSVISAGCESLKKYLRTRGAPRVGVDVLEEERDELQLERERLAQAEEGPPPASDYIVQFREAAASGSIILMNNSLGVLPSDLVGQGQFNFGSTLLHLNLSSNLLRLTSVGEHAERVGSTQQQPLDCTVEICQLRSLETLLLGFNRIESLDRFPWSQMANVSVVSLSDNKLRSLGRIYDAPLLASLSFENNNLTKVPCELGLCPHLRAIYMNGNPQRTVRGGVIAKGSTEILAYLKNKLPPNTVLSPPSPVAISRSVKSAQGSCKKPSSAASNRENSGTSRLSDNAYAAPVAPIEGYIPPSENAAIELELSKLSTQIDQLELQLDSHTLSAPKRFALKKELAMLRSKKIREARKLQ